MSEMLTNHYFHARDYAHALEGYDSILAVDPASKSIRRRMIICCLETGAIQRGLAIFVQLVLEDADYIINTHPVDDDCPCSELLAQGEVVADDNISLDTLLRLGMLWLYCDVEKSCQYFSNALTLAPDSREIKLILSNLQPKRNTLANYPFIQ